MPSRDQHHVEGPVEPKAIIEVFEDRKQIVEVHIGDRIIRATPRHPFFVKDQGWTAAIELKSGDLLATNGSTWVKVDQVIDTGEEEPVFNFHVADHHTYFVGGESWEFKAWVHNCSGCPPEAEVEFKADRSFHFLIRDNATSTIMFMGRIDDPLQDSNSLTPTFEEIDTSANPADALPGDANGDRVVDFADFLVLAQNFGKVEDAIFAEGDFDGNGAVNFQDFLLLAAQFEADRDAADQHLGW